MASLFQKAGKILKDRLDDIFNELIHGKCYISPKDKIRPNPIHQRSELETGCRKFCRFWRDDFFNQSIN